MLTYVGGNLRDVCEDSWSFTGCLRSGEFSWRLLRNWGAWWLEVRVANFPLLPPLKWFCLFALICLSTALAYLTAYKGTFVAFVWIGRIDVGLALLVEIGNSVFFSTFAFKIATLMGGYLCFTSPFLNGYLRRMCLYWTNRLPLSILLDFMVTWYDLLSKSLKLHGKKVTRIGSSFTTAHWIGDLSVTVSNAPAFGSLSLKSFTQMGPNFTFFLQLTLK